MIIRVNTALVSRSLAPNRLGGDYSREVGMAAGIRKLVPGEDPSMLGRFSVLIRPDLPERDFGSASMSCSEHVNSRPVPNRPFSRNYLRNGDFATARLHNPRSIEQTAPFATRFLASINREFLFPSHAFAPSSLCF
jgi:hypothetical protein